MSEITFQLTLPEVLSLPTEAVLRLLDLAGDQINPVDAYDLEAKGLGRWVVLNQLRLRFKNWPKADH